MYLLLQFFFFTVSLCLMILLIRIPFTKSKLHFLLLKELYPSKLENVDSNFSLMWFNLLDQATTFWFLMPFYYNTHDVEDFNERALYYHHKLIKINKFLLITTLGFIAWLLIGSFILPQ